MIHSYGALMLVIGTGALLVAAFINRCLKAKDFLWLLVTGLLGGLIGAMPIMIGLLQGTQWHIMSTSWIESNLKIESLPTVALGFIRMFFDMPVYGMVLCLSVGFVLLAASIKNCLAKTGKRPLWDAALLVMTVLVAMLYYGPQIGFSLLDPSRVTMFFTICMVIAAARCLMHVIDKIRFVAVKFRKDSLGIMQKKKIQSIAGVLFVTIFCFVWLWLFPLQLTAKEEIHMRPIEYDSAVGVYFMVKRDFPLYNWTLVAPVEQYQEALGYGYHYELWLFSEDFSIVDAMNPNFDVPIPTEFIFIYVEKIPLRIWTENELSTTQDRFKGPTEIYYRDSAGRAKLENHMLAWCEAYKKCHDNMVVYYEDDALRVYKIEHDPTKYISH